MIVIDEAHHTLAGTYQEPFRRYPDAKKLGMTARKRVKMLFDVALMLYVIDVQYFNGGGYWSVHMRACSYASVHKYCF